MYFGVARLGALDDRLVTGVMQTLVRVLDKLRQGCQVAAVTNRPIKILHVVGMTGRCDPEQPLTARLDASFGVTFARRPLVTVAASVLHVVRRDDLKMLLCTSWLMRFKPFFLPTTLTSCPLLLSHLVFFSCMQAVGW